MHRIVALVLVLVLALSAAAGVATAQQRDLRAAAARLAAAAEPPPDAARSGPSTGRRAARLVLVGAGLVLVLAGNPQYVPSRFAPGNTPRRVDLETYLGAGSYPGHSYQLLYRRGSAFGTGYGCPSYEPRCSIEAGQLEDQYAYGFTDGYDVGRHEGLVAGHAEGFAAGQTALIRILDGAGLVVYEGRFAPASYVGERFADRRPMRYVGAGLLAAGALLDLFWPRAPDLELTPLPGAGRVAASLGF